jgi:hypothetical protein
MDYNFRGIGEDQNEGSIAVFNTPVTVSNLQWHDWAKPAGKTFCEIVCVGGGGGGGGGFTRVATNAGAGGSGGGSSSFAKILIPLSLLPDRLFIQVGAGGAGTLSGGGTAGSGLLSFVCVYPGQDASNRVIYSGNAAAVGGKTGTLSGQTGGAGGTVVASNPAFSGPGIFQNYVGQAGADDPGAETFGGGPVIPVTGNMCLGGCSGAGILVNGIGWSGGTYATTAGALVSESIPSVPAANGTNDGGSGPMIWRPFISFGGCGGSSADTVPGGRGGNGNYGAGGGGGGSGTTGGRGGDGGCGIVIIRCW